MSTVFDDALKLILKFEGGYSNHPSDPGGETNFGICQIIYDKYRIQKKLPTQSVKHITSEEVHDIYFNNYWNSGKCNLFADRLAIVHFDACVNTGIFQASKFLQKSVGAIADGAIGPKTIDTYNNILNSNGLDFILDKYYDERKKFYTSLCDKKSQLKVFLKGWMNRINILKEYVKS